MRKDIDLTDPTATPSASRPSASATPTPSATATAYDKALQPVTVANGSGVPARTQEIMQAIKGAGFTQVGQLAARPSRRRRSTTVRTTPTWPRTSPPCSGWRRTRCSRPPASPESRSTWAATSPNGTPTADATPQLPADIVNQTAGDIVCQQANPALITR